MKKIFANLILIFIFFATIISVGCDGSSYFYFKNELETIYFLDELSVLDFDHQTNISKINYVQATSNNEQIVEVMDNTTLIAKNVGNVEITVTIWADNGEIVVCKLLVEVEWLDLVPQNSNSENSENLLTYTKTISQLNENFVDALITIFKNGESYSHFSFEILSFDTNSFESTKINNMIDIVFSNSQKFAVKIVDSYDDTNVLLIEVDS